MRARLGPVTEFIGYAEFGRRFFLAAVTEDRLAAAVEGLAGRPIDVGPLGVGPAGLIKVRADGRVARPVVGRRADPAHVAFDLTIPATLKIVIEIGFDKHRFDADLEIHLRLTARAALPLKIVIDVDTPTKDDVTVDLRADGMRASLVQVLGNVDTELRRHVARFLGRELEKPAVQEQCVIDVEAALAKLG